MPRDAGAGRNGLELVDHVARDEVDVVVAEFDAGVANSLPPQLVKLCILYPLNTLQSWIEIIVIENYSPRSCDKRMLFHFTLCPTENKKLTFLYFFCLFGIVDYSYNQSRIQHSFTTQLG